MPLVVVVRRRPHRRIFAPCVQHASALCFLVQQRVPEGGMLRDMVLGLIFLTTSLVTDVGAQTIYQRFPNGTGGSTTFTPNGTYQTFPNGAGGSTTFAPNGGIYQRFPNGAGGFTTFTPSGGIQQSF